MKKILALVLAVLMMATVAFAVVADYVPGAKIEFASVNTWTDAAGTKAATAKALNSDNYSISKITWNNGKGLVESVKFDDAADRLVVKLRQDYTNTKGKAFDGNVMLKTKKANTYIYCVVAAGKTVGYDIATCGITVDPTPTLDAVNGTATDAAKLIEFKKLGGEAYGDITLTTPVADVTVRVYDGEKYFLKSSTSADTAVLKANSDVNADKMDFIKWEAAPTFNATAKVYFYGTEKTDNVYVIKDGKVSKSNAKWSEDDACYVLSTRTLGSYVVTDAKLNVAADTAADKNPDTGANDVVGIATALAAVALVSAAAVSLKK